MNKKNSFPESNQPLFQVLSFDIVLGSLAVGLFAVTLLGVKTNPVWWIILPLAVWTVYTVDHLADGLKQKDKSTIYRHDYHYRYRKILFPLILFTGLCAIALTFIFLDTAIIKWGIVLSGFVLFYLLILLIPHKHRHFYYHKEVFIAFAYTSGIFIAPLVWYGRFPDYSKWLPVIVIFILVWCETVMVSFFDYDLDKADGNASFTVRYGKRKTRQILITALILTALWLTVSAFFFENRKNIPPVLIELLMLSVLLIIIYLPDYFKSNNLYRWFGEIVFWLPGFLVLFK
ncbi:MAG TPA: hypothetical protein ENH02_00755 [Bacteroidetes bacterium]|nr:hypothetical protein [Bacteroidota bacterium]